MHRFYSTLISGAFFCSSIFSSINAAESSIEAPPKEVGATTEKYTNKEKLYSIDYPSDWQKKEVPSIDFVLFAPPKGTDTQVHASMNVIAEKIDTPVNLNQFYKESVSNITTELKDVKIESSGETRLNDTQSKWVLYSHKMQDIGFRVLQYFVVSKDRVYLLTFSALSEDFATYKSEFEKIANSFKLLKDEKPSMPVEEKDINEVPVEA